MIQSTKELSLMLEIKCGYQPGTLEQREKRRIWIKMDQTLQNISTDQNISIQIGIANIAKNSPDILYFVVRRISRK